MTMNKEIKAEWVAALRSGEYEQGAGKLAWQGKFCCLGVLCEVAWKHGVVAARRDPYIASTRYDGEAQLLPRVVMEWAGLEGRDPYIAPRPREQAHPISYLNDVAGESFDTIADLIEEQL